MIDTITLLANKNLTLKPFNNKEDFKYLHFLIRQYKYDAQIPQELVEKVLEATGHLFWTLYAKDTKVGVVYTSYFKESGIYTIDGYRDNEAVRRLKSKISFSFEALKLVTDYMLNNVTDILWTVHIVKNRAATILCKRYGYKIEQEIYIMNEKFVVMAKRR